MFNKIIKLFTLLFIIQITNSNNKNIITELSSDEKLKILASGPIFLNNIHNSQDYFIIVQNTKNTFSKTVLNKFKSSIVKIILSIAGYKSNNISDAFKGKYKYELEFCTNSVKENMKALITHSKYLYNSDKLEYELNKESTISNKEPNIIERTTSVISSIELNENTSNDKTVLDKIENSYLIKQTSIILSEESNGTSDSHNNSITELETALNNDHTQDYLKIENVNKEIDLGIYNILQRMLNILENINTLNKGNALIIGNIDENNKFTIANSLKIILRTIGYKILTPIQALNINKNINPEYLNSINNLYPVLKRLDFFNRIINCEHPNDKLKDIIWSQIYPEYSNNKVLSTQL